MLPSWTHSAETLSLGQLINSYDYSVCLATDANTQNPNHIENSTTVLLSPRHRDSRINKILSGEANTGLFVHTLIPRGGHGSSVPDCNAKGTGFDSRCHGDIYPAPGCPLPGPPSLNGYWSMTGNLNTVEKGAGLPTSLCRWPSIMGVAMCPSAYAH